MKGNLRSIVYFQHRIHTECTSVFSNTCRKNESKACIPLRMSLFRRVVFDNSRISSINILKTTKCIPINLDFFLNKFTSYYLPSDYSSPSTHISSTTSDDSQSLYFLQRALIHLNDQYVHLLWSMVLQVHSSIMSVT
jgi:hypothetical protein